VASYEEWNHALCRHFTLGQPQGASIFFAVDDEVLGQVAAEAGFGIPTMEAAARDFCWAVRAPVCVPPPDEVRVGGILGRGADDQPRGVGFLAALALAAARMANDAEALISEMDFFNRLREVLGLPRTQSGRPRGMAPGSEAEQPIWEDWNRWLQQQGLLPTAQAGEGPRIYLNYALSQCLLRAADKDFLRRFFGQRQWSDLWDPETLLSMLRREAGGLTVPLRRLLGADSVFGAAASPTPPSPARLAAVAAAVAEVYETHLTSDWHARAAGGTTAPRTLLAGLYRVEDPIRGTVSYHLYPRMPVGRTFDRIVISRAGEPIALEPERRGWFRPLHPVLERDLDLGLRVPIVEPPELSDLILPKRRFWALVPDADDPESGVFASWGTPPLGAHFVLVCNRSVRDSLVELREEGVLTWDGEASEIEGPEDWFEIRDCQVLMEAWEGLSIPDPELADLLRPRSRLAIGASGGLRLPGRRAWFVDYGPRLTVFGFADRVDVEIVRVGRDREERCWTGQPPANQPFEVLWPGSGTFRVEAEAQGGTCPPLLVTLEEWDTHPLREPSEPVALALAGQRVRGAWVEPRD
jgi:hypothetical protein